MEPIRARRDIRLEKLTARPPARSATRPLIGAGRVHIQKAPIDPELAVNNPRDCSGLPDPILRGAAIGSSFLRYIGTLRQIQGGSRYARLVELYGDHIFLPSPILENRDCVVAELLNE